MIQLIASLEAKGVAFLSLTENIDTSSPGGRLIFHIFGALAEFERNLIRERTKAGFAAARARGREGGRPAAEPARPGAFACVDEKSGPQAQRDPKNIWDLARDPLSLC